MIVGNLPIVRARAERKTRGPEHDAVASGGVRSHRGASFARTYLPLLVLLAVLAITFRGWLSSGAINWGDWVYNPASRLGDYWPIPSIWDGATQTGAANVLSGPMLPLLFLEALLSQLHVPAALCMRLVWIFPGVLICAFSTYALALDFFGRRLAGIISALLAVSNTYIALIENGGQFTVASGYWLMPLALWLFYRGLRRLAPSRLALTALCLSVQVMYDLRSTYLTLGVLLFFTVFYALAQSSWRGAGRVVGYAVLQFVVAGVVAVLIHSFWLLPGKYSEHIALPAGYDSTDWVYRLSYMQLSHAFALFHPFWNQPTDHPYVASVDPLFFFLPLLIFAVFLRRRLTFVDLFLFTVAFVAIFLVKGDNPPAGQIYGWLFSHLPGFNMYRDPSKFYQPLGLAYALLLGRVATLMPLGRLRGWREAKGRLLSRFAGMALRGLVPLACLGILSLQLAPLASDTSWGTLSSAKIPSTYAAFNQYIDRQPQFFRILWYPGFVPFASYSSLHPELSSDLSSFFPRGLPAASDPASWFHLPQARALLRALSVKYIVVDGIANPSGEKAAIQLIRQAFPSFPETSFGRIHLFLNRSYFPSVVVADDHMTPAAATKLVQRATAPPVERRVGMLGEYATACHGCYTIVSHSRTRYEVIVRASKRPFLLVLNQSFDPNWAAYVEPTPTAQPFWWTWTHPAVAHRDHATVNGFANAWLIDAPGTHRIVIEYWPQRLTDVGWIISWLTILACVVIAVMPFVMRRFRTVSAGSGAPGILHLGRQSAARRDPVRPSGAQRERYGMTEGTDVASIGTGVEKLGATASERQPGATRRQRLMSNSLLRHNVLLFVAQSITSVFSYLFHPVVGHLLGAVGYGRIGALTSLGAVLLIPAGILIYIANKFAADFVARGEVAHVNYLFRRGTRYALLIGVLTSLGLMALSPVFAHFLKLPSSQLVIIISLGFVLAYAAPLPSGIIQGRQQFGWFATLNFLTAFLRVATTYIVLKLGFGIQGVLLAGLGCSIFVYALSFVPLRDVLRAPQERVPSFKPLLTYSVGAMLALGGGTFLTNTDIILVKHFLTSADAGYYAALAKMGQTVLFVSGSLVWVMFPKVAAMQQQGRSHHGILGWTIGGVFVISSAVLVLFWLFPSQIITLIFKAPAQVTDQLVWYGLAMLLLALANVIMYYYLSLGEMTFVPFLLACCVLQAVLILIWHGSIAQVVAMMVVTMAVLFSGLAILYVWQLLRSGGRTALARTA